MKAPAALLVAVAAGAQTHNFDVVVYGGTASGVIAAVAAAREKARTALVEPGHHLGGMTTGGLGRTDHGQKEMVGGYALEFYQRVGSSYGQPVAWNFEPHVAELALEEMVKEAGVAVFRDHRLREDSAVRKRRGRIREIFCEQGVSFAAQVFIDASYEGDLMARAGVKYTVGRESATQYGESLAGVRPGGGRHQFEFPVVGLDANKQLLPGVPGTPRGEVGVGDKKVPAYNFRLCLSKDPRNQAPFPRPRAYVPQNWALLVRYLEELARRHGRPPRMDDLVQLGELPNRKADANNRGPVSTDAIGASWGYPDGTYEQRARIWQDHIDYVAGFFYFLANDPAVPAPLREEVRAWGLCADEFADTNHWPHQLYIREGRRMVGGFVMTQRDLATPGGQPDAIGVGSAGGGSHHVQRYLEKDFTVWNEGDFEIRGEPYEIPYRVLLPDRKQALNLLATVCVSASHVAYSALRTEPVYMILGQAAGGAAKIAIDAGVAVQDVDSARLRDRLRAQGAVLTRRTP